MSHSVAFILAKMRAAVVARSLCSRSAASQSYMAAVVCVEALVVRIPSAVFKLGACSVQREFATPAPKVASLGKVPARTSVRTQVDREVCTSWRLID